jgi:hypothetical protein
MSGPFDDPDTAASRKWAVEMTADLLAQARAGDGEAFRKLTEPYRRGARTGVGTRTTERR